MIGIADLRKKYPQYNDMSDQEFADKFHEKFYSDMPKDEYYSKIGFAAAPQEEYQEEPSSFLEDVGTSVAGAIPGLVSGTMALPGEAYGAISHPLRTLKNIPIGLAEGAAGAFNLPSELGRYAASKGYLPEAIAKHIPHIPIHDIEEKLGVLPTEPGEALTRGLSGFGLWGKLGKFGEAGALKRAGLGAGYSIGQEENPLLGSVAAAIPSVVKGVSNLTNTSISKLLSKHKTQAINTAETLYNDLFDKVRKAGVKDIPVPKIESEDIIAHSQPKHHEALQRYIAEPTFENAHWAQSDLGFIERHLKKLDEKVGLSHTQHETLKNTIAARNRITQAMFEDKNIRKNPVFEDEYNKLSEGYLKNVVPYKQLDNLSEYEGKKITANNFVKSLLNNDEFMLGLGKNYRPQLLGNKILRSNIAKTLAGGALAGLGFEGAKKFLR